MPRVRHHTTDAGLDGIRARGSIEAARGWGAIPTGVHVEVEPFGRARPGRGGPKAEMGCAGEGAYVEFDAPPNMVAYSCGPRNTAVIPTEGPLPLVGRGPVFVRVRRYPWEFWRHR
jgi:hypothetical protein